MTWAQRPVLVIGGLGFIGANLTARLLEAGAAVTVVTPARERHVDQAAAFELAGARVVEGDVRNRELMLHAARGQAMIFNLSGQMGAVRSMGDPWTDLDVNCRGTLVLLEALREVNPAAKLVFVGSRLQYGRTSEQPVSEDAPGRATCLHGIHKTTAEQYLKLYADLFGLRFSAARVTNPFGPGQPSGRTAYGVVNRLIHLALKDEPLTIYGDGSQLRDYIHVDDLVSALMCLGASDRADGRIYNVGSGVGTRLVDMARTIVDMTGAGRVVHVEWPTLAEQVETGDFVANISRIGQELGWSPALSLREGLERTIAVYRSGLGS